MDVEMPEIDMDKMVKPVRNVAIVAFGMWIVGGLVSLLLSIGGIALTVYAVILVLQWTGVL